MLIDEQMARAILTEIKWRRRPVEVTSGPDGSVLVSASGGHAPRNLGSAIGNAKDALHASQQRVDMLT